MTEEENLKYIDNTNRYSWQGAYQQYYYPTNISNWGQLPAAHNHNPVHYQYPIQGYLKNNDAFASNMQAQNSNIFHTFSSRKAFNENFINEQGKTSKEYIHYNQIFEYFR